jgi:hypothetical protein
MTTAAPLTRFFERYAEISTGSHPEDLAALYAPTFIVGGPTGSQAFTNEDAFLGWLRQVADGNRAAGLRSMRPLEVRDQALSAIHTLATVRWGAQFARTGDRVIAFTIAYLLERKDEAWLILAYLSEEDQEDAMKREGLMGA